jgi:hypothetical protein
VCRPSVAGRMGLSSGGPLRDARAGVAGPCGSVCEPAGLGSVLACGHLWSTQSEVNLSFPCEGTLCAHVYPCYENQVYPVAEVRGEAW